MLRPILAATAIAAIAGSTLVYAQQRGHDGIGPRAERHHPVSASDLAAYTDARIAALKAGLELTPDQQKNWPAFEQALRDLAQLRVQRIEARQARMQQRDTQQPGATPEQDQGQRSPFDRLASRAERMAKASAALKKVAEAGAPLYQSLTDEQKARFKTLARVLRPHARRFAFNERWRERRMDSMGPGGSHRWSQPDDDGSGSGSQL